MGDTFRIAVATTDEINVDSHFGHTDRFVVFEVDSETGEIVDSRFRDIDQTACKGATCGGDKAFEEIAEQLSDVEFVLAARTGGRASQALARKDIITLDHVGPIDEAIFKVRDYRDKKRLRLEKAKKLLHDYGIEDEE